MPTREDVIHDILTKKELSGIEHAFVKTILEKELTKNPKLAKQLDTLSIRSAAYKSLVKAVRAVLRRNIGLYEGDPRHREALLAELRQSTAPGQREEIITHMLATHASTQERLPFSTQVYERIFALIGRPNVVLDIGCGLNPLAYPDRNATYICVDINRALCLLLEHYFSIVGMDGECRIMDVRGMNQIKKLPQADVAFLFKVLDLIDQKGGHAVSEHLLQALPASWLVVSFPTLKISGRSMRVPRRAWFEKMLARLGYKHTSFTIPNEIFYVIRKH